jgi:hypothetical protein
MENMSIREFYKIIFEDNDYKLDTFLDIDNKSSSNLGHFNVFDTVKFYQNIRKKTEMPYNRRLYYKIILK